MSLSTHTCRNGYENGTILMWSSPKFLHYQENITFPALYALLHTITWGYTLNQTRFFIKKCDIHQAICASVTYNMICIT